MPKTKAKTTERATTTVQPRNPLANGSFDEKAARDVLRLVEEKNIQIIDLKFNDMPGLWQHFSIPASELLAMDDIARTISSVEIPLGILTAIIGAPFFGYLIRKTRGGWS